MANVRISHLYKRYDEQGPLAVTDLNLSVADGEFLVLLGPSGCGKTTTLRCVAGLERQSDGDIHIGERLVNALPPGQRDIAFVFQFYALYPHLSAYDNIAFPLRAQKVPQEEVAERVQQVARLLRIEHILRRKPNRLPSGEQQRVALGRAMVRRPQVFLMDEPLTNLDAALRTDMRVELKHLQEELATTMLYVTHDQTEALSMAHRIAIMEQSILQQVGTPLEVYNRPANLFVAGFIGTPPMNLLPVALENGTLHSADGAFAVSNQAIATLAGGQNGFDPTNLVFGVRSEDVALTPPAEGEQHGTIVGRELLGDEIIYEVELGQTILRAKTEPTSWWEPGEQVGLAIDPARMHVFDGKTEARLAIGD